MTEEEKFNSEIKEITEIFKFLTEGEPSPDDEIDARELLIEHFSKISNLDEFPEHNNLIKSILQKLEDWDTLDLWFLETSIPNDIRDLLNIPQSRKKPLKEDLKASHEQITERTEIDVTKIVDKVSEQFKGEIEGLKGKIEELKKELEQKDKTLQSISQKKRVQKIILSKEPKLPPPKIKIPVFKKPIVKPEVKPKPEIDEPQPITENPIEFSNDHKDLTPIPLNSDAETKFNDTLPNPDVIEDEKPRFEVPKELEEIPIITEKRKITPIVVEESVDEPKKAEVEEKQSVIFSVEKPKVSSMKVEEVETGTIKSSSMDLFNVFSSVGEKVSKPKEKKAELKAPMRPIKEPTKETPPIASFINLSQSKKFISQELTPISEDEELPNDKDSLYQELIALEGKRYALEKNFKELDNNYQKGSISEADHKNQNDKLKSRLDEITSRINKIRRIIASL
ncbi:MAG: hypothetical protein ACFFEO_06155 [Candidatus Thorarchaeota archaeon]